MDQTDRDAQLRRLEADIEDARKTLAAAGHRYASLCAEHRALKRGES